MDAMGGREPEVGQGRSVRRRARRRNMYVGAGVAVALVAAAVVVTTWTLGGDRAGTLADGVDSIDLIEPASALANEEVHLSGVGFTGATDVQFNGVSVPSFNLISDTEISTIVPTEAVSGPISVVTPDGTITSASPFTALSPTIREFAPASARAGDTLRVAGANLAGVTAVRFGTTDVPVTSASDGEVSVVVPPNAVSGKIAVVNPVTNATSTTDLTVSSPAISDMTPGAGTSGTQVVLKGAKLGGLTSVTFNGVPGTVVSVAGDGNSATVAAPANVTTGKIVVTTASGTATSAGDFVSSPVITSFSPTVVAPGGTVVITGKNFTGATTVAFGGTAPSSVGFTVDSDTQITAVLPMEAVTGAVTVSGNGAGTSTAVLTVGAVITSFWPESAPPGTTISIYGEGLTKATGLKMGGVATPVTVKSDNLITGVLPTTATTGRITLTVGTQTVTSPTDIVVAAAATAPVPFDRSLPSPTVSTATAGLPAGGVDFGKAGTVVLAGMTLTIPAPTTTTTTTTTTTLAGATPAPQTPYKGTVGVTIGQAAKFSATVTYTDPLNWSITPAASQVTSVPIANAKLSLNTLTGTIAAVGGTITWGLTAKTVSSALVTSKFVFNAGATVAVSGTCPITSGRLCEGDGPWLKIDGNAGATGGFQAVFGNIVPAQTAGIAFQAGYDLSSGRFNLDGFYGAASNITGRIPDGRLRISFKDGEFTATDTDVEIETGSANAGLDIIFTGKSHIDVPFIGGFNAKQTVWYLDGGTMLSFTFPGERVLHEASLASATFLTGHGSSVAALVMGEPAQLSDGVWVFLGSMRLPTYVRKAFGSGDEGEVAVVVTMNGNGVTEIKGQFAVPVKLPQVPYVTTTFEGFSLALRFNESNPALKIEVAVAASGTIQFQGSEPMGVLLEVAIAFTKEGPEVVFSLTGSGLDGRAAWPDVLGVKDFDLDRFSLQIGLSLKFPYVSAGIAGTGTLPPKLLEYMGAPKGTEAPASFVVNLSSSTPCVEVQAGTPDSSSPLFAFPKDSKAISVTYYKVSASVRGCQVGIFTVPAGIVVAQKGTFLGVKRDYMIAFNPTPTGPTASTKTPSFYGWDTSSTSADKGAIKFKYKLKWGAGGWNPFPYFSLDGLLKLGDNNQIEVHGGCVLLVAVTNCYAEGDGTFDLGYGLKADLAIKADGVGSPLSNYYAKGDINLFGLKFGLEGSFSSAVGAPLGFDLSAWADLPGSANLVDKLGVRLGFGLRQTTSPCATGTCTTWNSDPLFALTVEGDTGGLFDVINGAADAFGAPPVADGGRYRLRTKWEPSMTEIGFGGSSKISLGALGTVTAGMGFSLCLETSCFGKVDAKFNFKYKKGGKTWSFDDIPLVNGWDFDYSTSFSDSFSKSGQVGDSWGGIKGSISGSIAVDVGIKSSPLSASLDLSFSLKAKAYIGAWGDWNYVGSVGVSYDSGSDKFCVKASGEKICL